MSPKLENTGTLPVIATSLLKSTAGVADPRLDSVVRLEQIALANKSPGLQSGQRVDAPALSLEQSLTLALQYPTLSDKTALSGAALLIDALLKSDVNTQQPKSLIQTQPLMAKVITDSAQLAQGLSTQLHKAVGQSGVFYESHLRQWSYGERSLNELQAEPQNNTSILHADASQWVPVQLITQEQQQFTWQGQVWPGQAMQWQINEDSAETPHVPNGEPQPAWNSALQLDFPGLGKISIMLNLVGEHVQVRLRAQGAHAAATLKMQGHVLSESLKAAGTTLDKLNVHHDEHT